MFSPHIPLPSILRFAILVLLLHTGGCAPQTQGVKPDKIASIHIIDRNGLSETVSSKDRLLQYEKTNFLKPQPYQKVTQIFGRDQKGNFKSIITSYHNNGQPRQYLEAENSRAKGRYREWHFNGAPKLEANVIGGVADLNTSAEESWLFDGQSLAWDEDGRLAAKIQYYRGELQGPSEYFHTGGQIWKQIPYEKGKIHGTLRVYYENGNPLLKSEYLNGVRDGVSTRYFDKDKMASLEHYKAGLLEEGQYFNHASEVISTIQEGKGHRVAFGKDAPYETQEYRDGIPEGVVRIYGENQSLVRQYHIKNGFKHGEETAFYPRSERTRFSINWHNGTVQGIVKTWFPNGNLESQREMSANKKNGLSTAWYLDGSIMLIEQYEDDKLINGEYFKKGESTAASKVSSGKGVVTLFDSEGNFLKKTSYIEGKPMV